MQARFDLVMHGLITKPSRLAVAYSGGLDSAVLLHLCAAYAKQHQLYLTVFHVHHAISPNADSWLAHCRQQCVELDLPFDVAHIQIGNTSGEGVEAVARNKRYIALGELCSHHQIDVMLTAHHQDDQAETMLLQLLRGTGVAGLCGMQQSYQAAGLLGNSTVVLARPLLEFTRAELESYAEQKKIAHIDDESNTDMRYRRNALRHQIIPLLAQYFPGYQTRFSRTAHHAQSALSLLEQFAAQDYAASLVQPGESNLSVRRLLQLSDARIDNVLRYWLAQHKVKMPGTTRLAEMRKQLLHARDDAQVCVKHEGMGLHRYRQQLSVSPLVRQMTEMQNFVWKGEGSLTFPAFSGTLFFDPISDHQPGINRAWLLAQQLQLRPRQGGERLKLAPNRPNRSIKTHYQTAGIPYWQREQLPFIFVGNELLFAAGVGVNGDFQKAGEANVTLRWQSR